MPLKLQSSNKVYTSEVLAFIESNKSEFHNDIRIVVNEVGINEIKRFIVYDSKKDNFDDRITDTSEDLSENGLVDFIEKNKQKNKEKIMGSVAGVNVYEVVTLEDNFKNIGLRESETEKAINREFSNLLDLDSSKIRRKTNESNKGNQISNSRKSRNLESLNSHKLDLAAFQEEDSNIYDYIFSKNAQTDSILKLLQSHKKTPFPVKLKLGTPSNYPYQLNHHADNTCFITMSSSWDAKKCIYGLRFMGHFKKAEVNLLGMTNFADHLDFLTKRIYKKINLGIQERQHEMNKIVNESGAPNPYDKYVTMSDLNTENLRVVQNTTASDIDILRNQEAGMKANIREQDHLKNEIDEYINSFIEKNEFTDRPYLKSNLADISEVDEVIERRGRRFEPTPYDERIRILEQQLEKSKNKFSKEKVEKTTEFNQNLNRLIRNRKPEDVEDIMAKLATEYGLKNEEISDFQTLLREKKVKKGEKRIFIEDHEKPKPEKLQINSQVVPGEVDPYIGSYSLTKNRKDYRKLTRMEIYDNLTVNDSTKRKFSVLRKSFTQIRHTSFSQVAFDNNQLSDEQNIQIEDNLINYTDRQTIKTSLLENYNQSKSLVNQIIKRNFSVFNEIQNVSDNRTFIARNFSQNPNKHTKEEAKQNPSKAEFENQEIDFAFKKTWHTLEMKYTGEYFESNWFSDYICQNFMLKKSK